MDLASNAYAAQRASDDAPRALAALERAGYRVETDQLGGLSRATAWRGNRHHYEAQALGHDLAEATTTLAWGLGLSL